MSDNGHNRRPGARLEPIRLRAELLATIRAFFATRDVLEVDTPTFSSAAVTDPNIHSFVTRYHGPGRLHGQRLFLHTSPEFAMKRLLAAGSGSIYQVAKVFRDHEAGDRHNPEFTLLEWYRVGFDHLQLMDEVESLLSQLIGKPLARPQCISYRDLFKHYLHLDIYRSATDALRRCAEAHDISAPANMPDDEHDSWLDLLLSHCIEPQLGRGRLTFIYDYPASQAALARIRPGDPALAERFEVYFEGVELGNGFHELNDAAEQRRRFETDNAMRVHHGLPRQPLDENFLAALPYLPDCAGMALGLDRLLMLLAEKNKLSEILPFRFEES